MFESLPTVPIWMDCNCGRFLNLNLPPKSLKLYSPIWMDSNDSQSNMRNDFHSTLPYHFCLSVNELFPILIVFNRFNPVIRNVSTNLQHWLPISIDSNIRNHEIPQSTITQLSVSFKCLIPIFSGSEPFPHYSSSMLFSIPLYHSHSFTNLPYRS